MDNEHNQNGNSQTGTVQNSTHSVCSKRFDTEHRDNVICPYCGHEHIDSWEIDFGPCLDGDCETYCDSCGERFGAVRHVTVTYSSMFSNREV